ncbi:MmcB family DNA repair protein [Azospirillum sp.]|uniref:MmcB family DNA repair protein n=1 Tax=Azospirillum sp. TaxID=34012 RepID=UPI003D72E57A
MNEWTHNSLAADLAAWRQRNQKRITFENMAFGDCRPDVFSLVKTLNPLRFDPITDEVKVSRGDFLADLRASKWLVYAPFSARIFFACPAGLIKPHEVPSSCGLIVRGAVAWEVVKRPMVNKDARLTEREWMKLVLGRWADRAVAA